MFRKKVVQNKVRIPKEIRLLLNVKNGDEVSFEVIRFANTQIVQIQKAGFNPVRIVSTLAREDVK